MSAPAHQHRSLSAEYALEEAVRLIKSSICYLAFLNQDESVLTMYSWSKTAMAECAIIDKLLVYPVASTDYAAGDGEAERAVLRGVLGTVPFAVFEKALGQYNFQRALAVLRESGLEKSLDWVRAAGGEEVSNE